MRSLSTNPRVREFVTNEEELAPGITFVLWQPTKSGKGRNWYPGIMVATPVDHWHTQGLTIGAQIKEVKYGYRANTFKLSMWRRNSTVKVPRSRYDHVTMRRSQVMEDAPPNYMDAYFDTMADAVAFMRSAAPEFFK